MDNFPLQVPAVLGRRKCSSLPQTGRPSHGVKTASRAVKPALRPDLRGRHPGCMIFVSLLSAGLILLVVVVVGYLVATLIRPEKF